MGGLRSLTSTRVADDGVNILWVVVPLAWLAWSVLAWRAAHMPRIGPDGQPDVVSGLVWGGLAVYARIYHGLRISGAEHVPGLGRVAGVSWEVDRATGAVWGTLSAGGVGGAGGGGGQRRRPVLIVCNHTAGVDPLLVQAACPFFIRWMMAADMKGEGLDGLWDFSGVIFVDRTGKQEIAGVREAVRELGRGQAVGVFPEGRLLRSDRGLEPFQPGIGLLVSRGDALVLPVVIRGTPRCESSWSSLFVPSRSSVEFKPVLDFGGMKAGAIAGELERRYREWLGGGESAK